MRGDSVHRPIDAGGAWRDNSRHVRCSRRPDGHHPHRGRAGTRAGRGNRLGAARRLHGAHPERRRAAGSRSGGARDRYRRLLSRLHQDAGRGMREPRLWRVAARRRRPRLRSMDGVRGRPVPLPRRRGMGRNRAAARGDGRAPGGLHLRLAAHGRVPAGRFAAPGEPCRRSTWPTASASVQVAPLRCRRTTSDGSRSHHPTPPRARPRGAAPCSKPWPGRRRWRCIRIGSPNSGHVEARRQAALEERNRLARDIHDTLTQGFAAILMQLQAAQRSLADAAAAGIARRSRPPSISRARTWWKRAAL